MSIGAKLVRTIISGSLWILSFVASPIARRLTIYLWFTPFPFARGGRLVLPDGARHVGPDLRDAGLDGYEVGDGPRQALLVHGWAGSSRQYRRIATRLADVGYRSVVIDLPGHGGEAGQSTDAYQLADAIQTAGKAMGPLDLVVAHSLGAMATGLAIQRTVETDRLVLLAPGVKPLEAIATFARGLRLRPALSTAIENEMKGRFGAGLFTEIPASIYEMRTPGRTLIIHDQDDDMVAADHSRRLAEAWGNELVITRGHGHNGLLRAPEVIDHIEMVAVADPTSERLSSTST